MGMLPGLLKALAAVAMLMQLAVATNYTVGGPSGGWDTSTDLQTWASSQTFSAGDNLIFQYTPNHDVLEVTKSEYDNCQSSNALQSYNDGYTIIPLTSAGKRYFICGTTGHCLQGMKVEIDTQASSTTPQPAAASPLATPVSAPTPKASTPAPRASSLSPSESPIPVDAVIPPSPSESKSPSSSPSLSPDVPEVNSPETSPTPSSLTLPTPTPLSSANKESFQTSLILGVCLVAMMLLAF
ncbi:hypothetical protein SLA2020_010010 [Shorea laevis]